MLLKTYVEELPRGGRKKLAIQLGVSSSYLARLLSGDRSITAERALQIESVTQGAVTRYELRPDLQWGSTKRSRSTATANPSPTLNQMMPQISTTDQSGKPSVHPSSTTQASA